VAGNLQSRLCALVDAERLDDLADAFAATRDFSGARRVRELRDPSVNHDRLWAFNPSHGACLGPDEFVLAVRLRIGAPILAEPVTCPRCKAGRLDTCCVHAACPARRPG